MGVVFVDDIMFVAYEATDLIIAWNDYQTALDVTAVGDPSLGQHFPPTGMVVNKTNNFIITGGNPALIIIATEAGTLNGFNSDNFVFAEIIVNNSASNADYKGLAIAHNKLYVANFKSDATTGTVDIFDGTFTFIGNLTIPPLEAGFSPFNVAYVHKKLYVTYAKKNPADPGNDLSGPGNGFIDKFKFVSNSFRFVRRSNAAGVLNSPWAVIEAPRSLGFPFKSILVGNFGDGRIVLVDSKGNYLSTLNDWHKEPHNLLIDGLWGLATNHKQSDKIYFAAGPNCETNGLIGVISERHH